MDLHVQTEETLEHLEKVTGERWPYAQKLDLRIWNTLCYGWYDWRGKKNHTKIILPKQVVNKQF